MRRLLGMCVIGLMAASIAGTARAGNDYTDPAYAKRDLKNMWESTGRNQAQLEDPNFFLKVQEAR